MFFKRKFDCLKTIYQTNMAQAYEAGRQSVMWDDNPLFPYVQYSAILDNKTRPAHRALHGVVMRKSDPAWQFIKPKNGYKCRCTTFEMMEVDVKSQDIKVRSSDGYLKLYDVDVSHGGVAQIARIEFPGFAAAHRTGESASIPCARPAGRPAYCPERWR